ncbi:MAG: hypothetical protein LCH56_15565 [Proteobacteria bacterium]|nr:hypothetical protein [Pseudomonadota bacterium]
MATKNKAIPRRKSGSGRAEMKTRRPAHQNGDRMPRAKPRGEDPEGFFPKRKKKADDRRFQKIAGTKHRQLPQQRATHS